MDFPFYKNIKGKLKKRSLPTFKKTEDTPNQMVVLAKQLDDHVQLDSDVYHQRIAKLSANLTSNQVGEYLTVARNLSKTQNKSAIKEIVHVYTQALLMCDRSFIRPIRLEMGRFYESQQMFSEAAECYKQSMNINSCVQNLILAKKFESALNELKNWPSHLMTSHEYTSMFLLQILLDDDLDELKRCSLQHLAEVSRTTTGRGIMPLNDHLFNLTGLLESLLIIQQDQASREEKSEKRIKDAIIKNLIVNRLRAFLVSSQIQLLNMINSGTKPASIVEMNETQVSKGDDNDSTPSVDTLVRVSPPAESPNSP